MSRALKGNKTYRFELSGRIQGVGFRPLVFRKAKALGLTGRVSNTHHGAVIEINAAPGQAARFLALIKSSLPPNSEISFVKHSRVKRKNFTSFSITDSLKHSGVTADIPPDLALCGKCLKDILSPSNRRKSYPFTNCTECGPRYSIIKALPYDRAKTTMNSFRMCPDCLKEYNDPFDRRFHAQPNACPACGPKLRLLSGKFKPLLSGDAALNKTVELLKTGRIVAIKSIGGYHLACDAFNASAVQRLRSKKSRPHKPLAVMMPDTNSVRKYCRLSASEETALTSPAAPIVLLNKRSDVFLPEELLAPGNAYLGVMLPYTPLHRLLFSKKISSEPVFSALVMTSGNKSDEPICTGETELKDSLSGIADYYLVHDRPVHNRCDDSIVFSVSPAESAFIRKSRGFVPDPVNLFTPSRTAPVIFAAGAEQKNAFCLVRDGKAYNSQFIGDLDNYKSTLFYREAFKKFQGFLDIKPSVVAYDLHPDYYATRFAKDLVSANHRLTGIAVQHHHAHIASVMAEKMLNRPVLGFAFDGTGLGSDGNIWGGECLLVKASGFERLAHFEYFHLPGGDIAAKEIWRLAVSLIEKCRLPSRLENSYPCDSVRSIIDKGVNSPLTSSVGRLFDAVAAVIGLRSEVSFEAQAAMELESLAVDNSVRKGYNFEVFFDKKGSSGPAVIGTERILEGVLKDVNKGVSRGLVSARFHYTLSDIIVYLAKYFGRRTGIRDAALSGGVFQNRLLLRLSAERLVKEGFRVHFNTLVPANDGGIALGQAWVAYNKKIKIQRSNIKF